jgi:predicted DCC family thiol-disulfide oxidoreductase YuxK
MLTVLYDGRCGFCVMCRDFLRRSSQRMPLEFLDLASSEARTRYGSVLERTDDLVVVDAASGSAWVGPDAFFMCFWALARWSLLAELLIATPLYWPCVAFFAFLSRNRGTFGALLRAPRCEGSCGVPSAYR